MAGGSDADADGGGVGAKTGARAARGEECQLAGHGRGAGAGRAAGARLQPGAGAGRGRAVRAPGRRRHRRRRRPAAGGLQDRPQHAHHARNTPASRTRCHQLDQPVAAILKKLDARRHHHHQPPVHDREEETVQEPGGVKEPVIARDASEPTDCPPRYLRIVIFNKYQYYYMYINYYIFLIREKSTA